MTGTTIAFGYPARFGQGGLGASALTTLRAMGLTGAGCVLLGPGPPPSMPDDPGKAPVRLEQRPDLIGAWRRRWTPLRYLHGRLVFVEDRGNGRWLAPRVRASGPTLYYGFSQISLETLRALASTPATRTIVDHPFGDARHYRDVFTQEARQNHLPNVWHPTRAMIDRIFEELTRAHMIRTSSEWSRRGLIAWGIDPAKMRVVPQSVDCQRFAPRARPAVPAGPLRVCYVGAVSLGKGIAYLLGALHKLGPAKSTLRIVGASGDPVARRLLVREGSGLTLEVRPGDPVPALQDADVLVLPSLHDGFGLVVAEAMAAGVPVIVSDQCGAAEWVDPSVGWVVSAGNVYALAAALQDTVDRRADGSLAAMGAAARNRAVTRSREADALMLDLVREGLTPADPGVSQRA